MSRPSAASPPKTIFAARLRIAQKDAGLSNTQLSRAMDISESLLAKWKRGDNYPTFSNAERLAEILDKPLDFFTEPVEAEAAA